MIAAVRGVMAARTASGSRLKVTGSTSTNTGMAMLCSGASPLAIIEMAGTITSSPGPISSARSASTSASVPEETPTAWSVSQ